MNKEKANELKQELISTLEMIDAGEEVLDNPFLENYVGSVNVVDQVSMEERVMREYLYGRALYFNMINKKEAINAMNEQNAKPAKAPIIMPKYKMSFEEKHPFLFVGVEDDELIDQDNSVADFFVAASVPVKIAATVLGATALVAAKTALDVTMVGLEIAGDITTESMAMDAESRGNYEEARRIRENNEWLRNY